VISETTQPQDTQTHQRGIVIDEQHALPLTNIGGRYCAMRHVTSLTSDPSCLLSMMESRAI
jgi:hypothetical protein